MRTAFRRVFGSLSGDVVPKRLVDHPWDRAAAVEMRRTDLFGFVCPIEPGARFFVLALERLGARTTVSCEGHPEGFFVNFTGSHELAEQLSGIDPLTIEVLPGCWRLSAIAAEQMQDPAFRDAERVYLLRQAADAMIRAFPHALGGLA